MKTLFFVFTFLTFHSAFAQEDKPTKTICEASKSCAKACRMKEMNDQAEDDTKYQKMLAKCAEDVGRELKLIE